MKARARIRGYKETRARLREIADKVPDAARGQMKRSAERIVKLARLQTPVDEQDLENSIRVEKTYGNRGRLQIDIVAGGQTVVKGKREVSLDQYAWIIHERYSSMQPGKRTLEKMAANPTVLIGEKFLERAVATEEPKLREKLVFLVGRIVRGKAVIEREE